ncbi:aminopeptidase P family protein [Candidatus Woesearchaeota archaeon]|nr:aminopeptidase P family protein [Candidatus Woesearchaeota archaeon]
MMKIKGFQDHLKEKGIDAAVFMNMRPNANFFYFTGYDGAGVLVVPKSSRPFLVVPEMESERAGKTSRVKNVVSWSKKEKLFPQVKTLLKRKGVNSRVVGVDFASTTLDLLKGLKKGFRGVKIKDVGAACRQLRMIKTADEIKLIKESFRIANRITKNMLGKFRTFRTETDAANYLRMEAIKQNCGMSFPPIVASGSNASMPHYAPQKVPIKKGFCVVDFGVTYRGYCTDITRMVYVGKPNEKEIGLYNFLLRAQENGIKNIGKGVKCAKLYKNAVRDLRHYAKFFTHGLGHGVGIEIHELPNLSPKSKDKIEKNMVFTIEPGLYLEGKFGMRIEDTVMFNGKKAEILTKVTKRLAVVK